jgi:hypothetical protein
MHTLMGAAVRGNCIGIEDNILGKNGQLMGAIKQVEQMIRLADIATDTAMRGSLQPIRRDDFMIVLAFKVKLMY